MSDADALIESLEQLLAKKRQLKQGAMQELLTGKKRLPGFSRKWDERRIEDEQTAIAAILSDMDAEIAALEAKLAKARQLKQG